MVDLGLAHGVPECSGPGPGRGAGRRSGVGARAAARGHGVAALPEAPGERGSVFPAGLGPGARARPTRAAWCYGDPGSPRPCCSPPAPPASPPGRRKPSPSPASRRGGRPRPARWSTPASVTGRRGSATCSTASARRREIPSCSPPPAPGWSGRSTCASRAGVSRLLRLGARVLLRPLRLARRSLPADRSGRRGARPARRHHSHRAGLGPVPAPLMTWAPLLEGEEAARALAAAEAIAATSRRLPAGLEPGHAGLALFFAYLERSLGRAEAGELAERHLEPPSTSCRSSRSPAPACTSASPAWPG